MDNQGQSLYSILCNLHYTAFTPNKGLFKKITRKEKNQALLRFSLIVAEMVGKLIPYTFIEVSLGRYVDLFFTADLKLYIVLNNEGKQFLKEQKKDGKDLRNDQLLDDLLEDHVCNGYALIPSDYCGMTSCNLILTHSNWGLEFSHDENWDYFEHYDHEWVGRWTDEDTRELKNYSRSMVEGDYIWYDELYQIRSQVEDFYNDGMIELDLHLF